MARLISFFQDLFIRKLGPPVIGAFVVAWMALNWDHLILLFWGSGLLEERVETFRLALEQGWCRKYIIPTVIAFLYLVGVPYVSLVVSRLQTHAKTTVHTHRVKAEKTFLQKDRELNIERVLADPNKSFIEDLARQKIESGKLALEKQQSETEKKQAEAEIVVSEAVKHKAEQADNEVKIKRAEAEKLKLESASQIQKATIASNRFPAAYAVMSFLDEALKADDINLTFEQITSITAILFGYKNVEGLIDDPQFNNETISKLLGVLYDAEELSKQIYSALANDEDALERFDSSLLVDYFYDHPFIHLLDLDSLDDMAQSFVENNQNKLFEHDRVTGAMAETNTTYDEVTDIEFNSSDFDEHGYKATFSLTIEGHERREASVRGLLPLSITATVRAPLILAKKGLGGMEFGEVSAEIIWP